jgi:RimJ/RimL family protein N-acetyltransferase
MSVIIVPVEKTQENGILIMDWRNDEITRKMSFNQEIKIWDTFKTIFYDDYFNHHIPPLFAVYDNYKIAFIGFTNINKNDNKCITISINIDPLYRNKGLGKSIILKSIEYIKERYSSVKSIIANIKLENLASIKVFKSCDFKCIDTYEQDMKPILVYEYILI